MSSKVYILARGPVPNDGMSLRHKCGAKAERWTGTCFWRCTGCDIIFHADHRLKPRRANGTIAPKRGRKRAGT